MTPIVARAAAARLVLALAICSGATAAAQSQPAAPAPGRVREIPEWAFPTTSAPFQAATPPFDSVTPLRLPKSTRAFTLAQVKNQFEPPDWYPETHPRMPTIVGHGRPRAVWACGYCHLPDGQGRSENATLAGLRADYMMRQVQDFRTRARRGVVDAWSPTAHMYDVADSATAAEVAEAARYFSRLKARRRYRVIEAATIPATYQIGGLYAVAPAGGTQSLAGRLIEVTENAELHELRDARETFTTYVPPGSILAGRRLATTLGAKPARACVSCHGPDLRGTAIIPALAGRSPAYLLRQLLGFSMGVRAGAASGPMQGVASALTLDDMIAVAAYAGSLRP